ncbi:MAG: DUF3881 family protein [Alistipes sp.]|nr:DUF3881 family protein [Alistipes sp.]
MHSFLRSVGFYTVQNPTRENKLLRKIIKEAVSEGRVKCAANGVATIMAPFGDDFGVCVKGTFNGIDKFKMEYYFPYLLNDTAVNVEDISIERHADKDSYAVVCDEVKTGVTLIFYLQNIVDYYQFKKNQRHVRHLYGRSICLSGLSNSGTILLPLDKSETQIKKSKKDTSMRNNLIVAARNGDEEAIESLTIEDLDIYSQISRRIAREDLYSIVDTTFMPYGVECDQYSVIGEILELKAGDNPYTNETVYTMVLDCNDILIKMAVNRTDLMGIPEVGRRFKGNLWISAHVNFE